MIEEKKEEASCEHVRNDKRSTVPVGYVAFTLGNDLIPLVVLGEKNFLIRSCHFAALGKTLCVILYTT